MSVQFGQALPTRNRYQQRDMSRQRNQRDTSLLHTSPSHTVTSPPRSASVFSAPPPLPSVGSLPSATRVMIDKSPPENGNIIKMSGYHSTNKDCHGKIFDNHFTCKLNDKGLGHVVFPGGANIMFRYAADQIIKGGRQHNVFFLWLNHSLPLDTALPVRCPAYVHSPDTVVLPVPMGFNPEGGSKLSEQVAYESDRLGEDLHGINNSIQAMRAYMKGVGYGMTWVAITFRNLPHGFATCGKFQDESTLAINPKGLTPIVDSNLFSAEDTTNEEQEVISTKHCE